jgi:transcriptional regulator with XRE-family HTH domain
MTTQPSIIASLGGVIRAQREAAGKSQEAFASEVGVHRTYLGAIERGERNPALRNLERIAAGLGTPLSALFAAAEARAITAAVQAPGASAATARR